MGYLLLWMENLVLWLLVIALASALAARLTNRWARRAVVVLGIVLPGLLWGAIAWMLTRLEGQMQMETGLRYPAIAMLVAVLLVGILVMSLGLRSGQSAKGERWRVGPLSIALVVTVLAHLMTFWNLDLSVRQHMDSMRIEAGSLALSVAPPKVPDRENAASLYQRAFEVGLLDKSPPGYERWLEATSESQSAMDLDDVDFVAYVRGRQPLMQLVRDAAARPACSFSRDWGRPSIMMLLPEVQNMRSAARDLQLEAHFKAAHGDVRGALENVVAMHQMAEHVGQEPLLVSLLVSFALDAMATSNLEYLLRTYPVTPDDLAVLDAWQPTPLGPRMQRAFRMEEAFGLSTFCQIAEWRDMQAFEGTGLEMGVPPQWGPNISPFYRVFFLADDVRIYRQSMNRWQHVSSLPFEQRQPQIDELGKSLSKSPIGMMTRLLLPALESVHAAVARAEARLRLAELAIAAHRYRLAQGNLPETMDALVEFQPTLVTRDPFGTGQLQLGRRDGRLVLYSIGPDLQDDGAAPFDQSTNTGDLTFVLQDAPPSPCIGLQRNSNVERDGQVE